MQLLHKATDAPGPEVCADELLEALPPVMRFLRKHMRGRRRGLSMPQFRTLALLAATPATNLSAVAEFIDASLPTASRIVTGLVDKGYVARHECPTDRRQVELSLTTKGKATLEAARAYSRAKLVEELSHLDPDRLRSVSGGLHVLYDVFAPQLRSPDAHRGKSAAAGNCTSLEPSQIVKAVS